MYCVHPVGYASAMGREWDVACKCWRCFGCAPVLKKQLLDRLQLFFNENDEIRFLTLTVRKGEDGNIRKNWNKLRQYIRRHYPGIKMFAVLEFQRNGTRHIHVLINQFIDRDLVLKMWQKYAWGTMAGVDIRYIGFAVRRVAAYMFKYLGKSLSNHQYKPHERRYSVSGARLPKLPKPESMYMPGEVKFEFHPHLNRNSPKWQEWMDHLSPVEKYALRDYDIGKDPKVLYDEEDIRHYGEKEELDPTVKYVSLEAMKRLEDFQAGLRRVERRVHDNNPLLDFAHRLGAMAGVVNKGVEEVEGGDEEFVDRGNHSKRYWGNPNREYL